jgi:predicted nucleotidyltransferase
MVKENKLNWELALDKFLESWKNNKEVTGIIICGSYITGNPTKHSDIDIQIILKRGCKWRERGNKIVDGILMEYFANPPERMNSYFEDDEKRRRKTTAHMIVTGKIYLDKDGEAKKLKILAKKYLDKKFDKMPNFKIELNKYHLFDMADNLEEVFRRNTPDFLFVYYNFLRDIFDVYSEFLGYNSISENKMYRFLTDRKDKIKYHISDFPDKIFVSLFVKAMKEKNKDKMLKIFSKLVKHVQNKMGGFNIDGWRFRSSAK